MERRLPSESVDPARRAAGCRLTALHRAADSESYHLDQRGSEPQLVSRVPPVLALAVGRAGTLLPDSEERTDILSGAVGRRGGR